MAKFYQMPFICWNAREGLFEKKTFIFKHRYKITHFVVADPTHSRRLVGKSPMINVDFTWYCNFLTISYSTILLSACSNPVIYFYFAYKQVGLDLDYRFSMDTVTYLMPGLVRRIGYVCYSRFYLNFYSV